MIDLNACVFDQTEERDNRYRAHPSRLGLKSRPVFTMRSLHLAEKPPCRTGGDSSKSGKGFVTGSKYQTRMPKSKAAQGHLILTEDQLRALERSRKTRSLTGRSRPSTPGYLDAQDTYYVGTIKCIGRIYQQIFIDTYAKVAFAKLYDRKNALIAADMLNDRVLPFYEEHDVRLLRVLGDRGTEYCGNRESHEYQLYSAGGGHRPHPYAH